MQRTFSFKLHWVSPNICVPLFYDMNEVNFTTRTLLGEPRETLYYFIRIVGMLPKSHDHDQNFINHQASPAQNIPVPMHTSRH